MINTKSENTTQIVTYRYLVKCDKLCGCSSYPNTRQGFVLVLFLISIMWLTLVYLLHEYVAKNTIPNYKTLFEAREAATRLVEVFENQPGEFYKLSSPIISSL